jgi:hypothetical protein
MFKSMYCSKQPIESKKSLANNQTRYNLNEVKKWNLDQMRAPRR